MEPCLGLLLSSIIMTETESSTVDKLLQFVEILYLLCL